MADNASDNSYNSNSFASFDVLEEGVRLLCQNDSDIQHIISPRKDEIIQLLCRYIAEIEAYNPSHSLVGTDDRMELIKRHILDSLAPIGIFYRLLPENNDAASQIADAGSGAGLPGIPLAIAMPHIQFTLIERMKKRANFLRHIQKFLSLSNVKVVEEEMEKFAHNLISKRPVGAAQFDLVTFRAFRPFEPRIIKGLFRLCAKNGVIAAYKGQRVKIEEEITALQKYFSEQANGINASKLPFQLSECKVIPCPVPLLDGQRHVLIIRFI